MPIPSETTVALTTGQLIRNLLVTVVGDKGGATPVLMQVTSITDERGNLLNLDQTQALDKIVLASQQQVALLSALLEFQSDGQLDAAEILSSVTQPLGTDNLGPDDITY